MTSTVRLFLAFILLSPVVLPSVRAQDADFEALLNDLNPMAESTATEASASAESTAENLVPVEAETAGAAPVAESVIEIDMAGETAEAPSSELAETVDLEAETAPAVETEAAQPVESIEAGADATTESAAPAATPSSEADILAQQEEVRRQAADEQSRKNYAAAKQALEKKNYEEAVRLLEVSQSRLAPAAQERQVAGSDSTSTPGCVCLAGARENRHRHQLRTQEYRCRAQVVPRQ